MWEIFKIKIGRGLVSLINREKEKASRRSKISTKVGTYRAYLGKVGNKARKAMKISVNDLN